MCYILYIVLRASWKISLLAKCCHPHKIKSLLTYLLRRCIRKKFFDSFSGKISISDIIKFCVSNEKMLNGERFITGYTKRRLFVGE